MDGAHEVLLVVFALGQDLDELCAFGEEALHLEAVNSSRHENLHSWYQRDHGDAGEDGCEGSEWMGQERVDDSER